MDPIRKGYILNFMSVIIMAIGPLVAKFGLLHISASKAAVINTMTVIFVSYIWGRISKNKVQLFLEKKMILLALFNGLGVIFLFISMDLLSPVEIGFLGRFYTVFAVLLSVILLGERLTKIEMTFIVAAILGAFLFVNKGGDFHSSVLGSVFALLYTFFFALTNVYIKKAVSKDKNSNSIIFTNSCVSLIFIILYAIVVGDLFNGAYTFEGISLIALSSMLSGFIGTILLYEALKYLRFSIANVSRALSPLLLAAISFPFFPVKLTALNITGAVLLMVSILLLTFGDQRTRKPSEN
ncbi:DMT family transporter [Pseudalkalibacillus berkeleyi]|uniref:DMT family transporter n=1 Tax=Pseudalkalibacillus berkeleyi TaxID=1069813 RepID=A0ABS9GYC9_9BACL|nr:DMT family transporter [Pseudalkalibacillus berkeleyi]MCF6136608.1 DMT family transporter [Pseudalkalibacillus berkeleyi]